ncbi:MAG: hypothetical protein ACYC5X_15140 [Syntrophales bacterium]
MLESDPPADGESGERHEEGAGGAGRIRRVALRVKGIYKTGMGHHTRMDGCRPHYFTKNLFVSLFQFIIAFIRGGSIGSGHQADVEKTGSHDREVYFFICFMIISFFSSFPLSTRIRKIPPTPPPTGDSLRAFLGRIAMSFLSFGL